MPDRPGIGQELVSVSFPDLVKNLGLAISEAQVALDMNSMRIAQFMAGYETDANGVVTKTALVQLGDKPLSLLELGFTPTFYQFVETVIEIKISISMSSETSSQLDSSNFSAAARAGWSPVGAGGAVRVSSVNASYAAKYQYQAEGSSVLRTKLVPVPIPAMLEARIRRMLEPEGSTT